MTTAVRASTHIAIPKLLTAPELGAIFLSALAYPTDTRKREKFAAALVFQFIDEGAPPAVRWLAKSLDESKMKKVADEGTHIIARERLTAAKMIWPKLSAAILCQSHISTPPLIPAPLSQEVLGSVAIDLDDRRSRRGPRPRGRTPEQNDENVKSRVWKPSLPALHLAAAYHLECGTDEGLSWGDVLTDENCSRRMLDWSAKMRATVARLAKIEENQQLQYFYQN